MSLDRRVVLNGFSGFAASPLFAGAPTIAWASAAMAPIPARLLVDDVERRTFNFFWQSVNRKNGLVPDRFPASSPGAQTCNISSVGFAIVAYAVGAERGWISRSEAVTMILTTLKFFDSLPMGDSVNGCAGYKGFYYHYLDLETGLRATSHTELSPIHRIRPDAHPKNRNTLKIFNLILNQTLRGGVVLTGQVLCELLPGNLSPRWASPAGGGQTAL